MTGYWPTALSTEVGDEDTNTCAEDGTGAMSDCLTADCCQAGGKCLVCKGTMYPTALKVSDPAEATDGTNTCEEPE